MDGTPVRLVGIEQLDDRVTGQSQALIAGHRGGSHWGWHFAGATEGSPPALAEGSTTTLVLDDGAGHCLMEATLVKTAQLLAAALAAMPLQSNAAAEEPGASWVSVPRSLVTIDVRKDGGRVTGPGWEYRFAATARNLDFEIEPGRRLVLRRSGEVWVGEYYHPRIRPGAHKYEEHRMKFVCGSGRCGNTD